MKVYFLLVKPVLPEKQMFLNQDHFSVSMQAGIVLKQLMWKNQADTFHKVRNYCVLALLNFPKIRSTASVR